MPIFLVRHGETRLTGAFCGSSDPGLTPKGRAQARRAARQLSKFSIDRCYCSPLLRTRQTAAIAARRVKRPVIVKAALRELDFGRWEGLRFPDIEKQWPTLASRWAKDPMSVRIPGSESFIALRERVKRFLTAIMKKPLQDSAILIVGHGGSLAAIVLELLRLPNKEFPKHIPAPGSVRRIDGGNMQVLC